MVSQVRQMDARADALKPSDSGAAGSVTLTPLCMTDHFDASSPGAEARRRHAATQGQPKHSTTATLTPGVLFTFIKGLKRLHAAYNPARRAHRMPSGASNEQLFYQGQLGASGSMTQSVQLTHNGTRHVRWMMQSRGHF
ncbi:hypothetical protein PCANC_05487 [Puccinia coronata f. sp. avenae]|uniref:Uncharacterized protein n=1 Tax=Puccinia coronata f. sp. avenae TaxID=200324 RepID=A0A2N5T6J0_9BASI|nr:hypothetical protein PCANC_05487 [Puccinia coronata f. sp. avenae]